MLLSMEECRRIATILGSRREVMTDDCLLELTNEFADFCSIGCADFDRQRFKAAVAAAKLAPLPRQNSHGAFDGENYDY